MNSETAIIQPRSRRLPAHSPQCEAKLSLQDPRTRILIRVPMVQAGNCAKTVCVPKSNEPTHAAPIVKPIDSPATAETTSSAVQLPVSPPTSEARPFLRIDSAHTAAPAPHTASPAWSQPSDNWLAKLASQRLVWAAALVTLTALAVNLLRTDKPSQNRSTQTPSADSAQNNAVLPVVDPAPDSNAAVPTKKRRREERMTQRQSAAAPYSARIQATDEGPALAAPDAMSAQPKLARQPELVRRYEANTPAKLQSSEPWPPSSSADSPQRNSNSQYDSASRPFQIIDQPATGLPQAPTSQPTTEQSIPAEGPPRAAARFNNTIGPATF